MAKEIERKFLVKDDSFMPLATESRHIVQGYLCRKPTVRVRIADDRAWITVKTRNQGITRDEWEYPIPAADARQMLDSCADRVVEKTRYIVPYAGFVWEVDIFEGRNRGLALAEIELPAEDTPFELPPFAGDEVTGIPRYYNSNM